MLEAKTDDHFLDEYMDVFFASGNLPQVCTSNSHAILWNIADTANLNFLCSPWLNLNTGRIDNIIRASGSGPDPGSQASADAVLCYLENFLPWDKEP